MNRDTCLKLATLLLVAGWGASAAGSLGQERVSAPPGQAVTLEEAAAFAAKNYPAIRASLAEVAAAGGGIELARNAYLPRADLLLGFNRATRNNVFGLILPNGVIPAISGPAQDESTYSSTFGSAAGALLSWEPVDFGLRKANVQLAEAMKDRARAGQAVTEYQVSLAVVDVYLSAVANQQAVAAAQATVERRRVFSDSVAVLVNNELRPGADHSRARAELARAQTELIRAEEQAAAALATLAEWMGLAGGTVEVRAAGLAGEPPAKTAGSNSVEVHPLAQAQEAEVAVAEAKRRALDKEWRPKLEVQSALYGRGTGARLDGTFHGGAHGLAPSEANWALGFNISLNLLDYKQNRVRRRIEAHRKESEEANKDRVVQELQGQVARARIAIDAARRVAQNTPIELDAAGTLETQAQARYRAGLGTVVEVAEAQGLLRQAEVGNALARLGVWRALFSLAAAQGEMEELLSLSSR